MKNQPTKYEVKCRLKKGDEVIVISGSCKGQSGKIDRVDRKHDRVYIAGINTVKRHTRPSMSNQEGGIIEKTAPLHLSNVMLLDAKKKKATRIGYKIEDGRKIRFAKVSGVTLT